MVHRKRLGELLVESGLLDEKQLVEAVGEHRKARLKLGQYLVQRGFVQEPQIIDVVAGQLKIERYRPDRYPVETDLARVFPAEMAQKWQAAPLAKKGYLCTVAMTDPMDIETLDAIEVFTNMEVEPLICTQRELSQIMGSIYGLSSGLGGVMEEMEFDTQEVAEVEAARGELEVTSLQGLAEQAPVVRVVNSILAQAVREGASDVHLGPERNYVQVRFRIDGRLHEVPAPPKSMLLPIISRVKILSNMDIAVTRIPQDGRFTVRLEKKEINIRCSTIPTIYGENMVLRLLDMSSGIYSLHELGMCAGDREKIEDMSKRPYGLILSCGPTGSGKSTSLYAILQTVNRPDINIITVEDPVEYRIEKIKQVQLNPKAGMTFASGLRAILRQDPDVIMVGEIRDAETARIAVQAALTGHRVLSTLHANEAAGAVTRLLDMGIEPFLVSSVLLVSFAQRLVRTICPHCKESYRPSPHLLTAWGVDPEKARDVDFKRGRGCPLCIQTGYRGRTGIFEVLVNDETTQQLTLRRASAQEITRAARKNGKMRSLKEDAFRKAMAGITTLEEAASAVMV